MATVTKAQTNGILGSSISYNTNGGIHVGTSSVTVGKYDIEDTFKKLEKKCEKLEKAVTIMLELMPDDIKDSVKLALELEDNDEEM